MSKLTEEVKIRISPEDKERIKTKMEDAGILNMSAYVRKMALDGICVRLDLEDVRQLIVLLRRCSNNLNQYAKRANETGSIYAADIEDLQNRLDEIWELSRQSFFRRSRESISVREPNAWLHIGDVVQGVWNAIPTSRNWGFRQRRESLFRVFVGTKTLLAK